MQRQQAIQELIQAGKWIADKNMTWGSAGNMSVRLDADTLLITAGGTRFDSLSEDSFTLYHLHNGEYEGGRPSKELPVHLAVYRAVPWAQAVVHASPFHTTLAACSDLALPNDLFVENMYYLQRVRRIAYFHPGSQALAQAVQQAAPDGNVILMNNHGVLIYDASLTEALTGLEVTENTCRMALAARQAGLTLTPVDAETVHSFLNDSGYKKPRKW